MIPTAAVPAFLPCFSKNAREVTPAAVVAGTYWKIASGAVSPDRHLVAAGGLDALDAAMKVAM